MKRKRAYFHVFKEHGIAFGLKLGLFPVLHLDVVLPFREIRMGIVILSPYRQQNQEEDV